MKSLRIMLTGGGSGGHVTPLLAVAEELEALGAEDKLLLDIIYTGPKDIFAAELEEYRIKTSYTIGGKLRRYFSLWNIIDIPKLILAFFFAVWKLYFLMPDVVFSKGGTGALPIVFAAWFYRIPVIIHESDAVPGVTNLFSARFASRIGVSFEVAKNFFNPAITAVVGTPVRASLIRAAIAKDAAKEELGFLPDEPLILVEGGSQGSRNINNLIITTLADILKLTAIFHQTGKANFAEVESLTRIAIQEMSVEVERKHPYKVAAYFDEHMMASALSAADLVIMRAGSTSIYEAAAFAKPSIVIPLESAASDHQRANAYEYAKNGAAVVIEEENLLGRILLHEMSQILQNREKQDAMSKAALSFYKPAAARTIAEEILRLGFRL
jgi:UDP-N-acetylglucosamine--N-acetylmuramyl-(pentapeptide) pyrophosphoryl-undecaprenol N-acetylglucosamine transferase